MHSARYTLRKALCSQTRQYAQVTKPVKAQPLSTPRLDGRSEVPPPPSVTVGTRGGRSITVPTSSTSEGASQLVTLTLRIKALDIDAPSLGFDKASFPYVWLRDVCDGPESLEPSSRQKLFKTEDINIDVKPRSCKVDEQTHELVIEWDRPLKGKKVNEREQSRYKLDFLRTHANYANWRKRYRVNDMEKYRSWDAQAIKQSMLTIPCKKLESPEVVQAGIQSLFRDGIALVKDVPTEDRTPDNCDLIKVAERFGTTIQRTWYGDKVFSVRSYAGSKNIAYTSLNLDLHMDLLHYEAPPRWQLLHCLHVDPDLQGGTSYFVDAYKAAEQLKAVNPEAYQVLSREKIAFEYRNDGHWTFAERPTLQHCAEHPDRLSAVNYSPPFQAPLRLHPSANSEQDPSDRIRSIHSAISAYSKLLNDPKLRFEIQLVPGDCVIFDNMRVLHARTAFSLPASSQTAQSSEKRELRWLMGCYLDETSVKDRFRALGEQHAFADT